MKQDLVIGLDSSTQSTKAIAWSASGESIAVGRAPIPLSQPQPGWAEQDMEDWWKTACIALQEVTQAVDPARIAGLAISNQRETIAFLDDDERAVYPAIVWLDERATEDIELLIQAIGGDKLHETTGKPVDMTPVVYTLNWMRRKMPGVLAMSRRLLDPHAFLTLRLTGNPASSWTSADPWGMLDIREKRWDGPILRHLGLTADSFGKLYRPGSLVGGLTEQASRATGLAAGLPVYAAGGDGQCAGLGVNAVMPGTVYLNLGTAIITGAWSEDAKISHHWRTMTSPTGEGYFLEGVQRTGAFFLNWFADVFASVDGQGHEAPGVLENLEALAREIPIGSQGARVCSYLSGVMDPYWDSHARASFQGLGAHHTTGHLYRASLESLTLESVRCVEAMTQEGLAPQRILAVGGGANSALWVRMIADATGLPLTKSQSLEASALGAGISAAVGASWFSDFAEAARTMSQEGETLQPDPTVAKAWRELSEDQAKTYRPSPIQ